MRKRKEVRNSIMHAIHHFLAAHHVAMMNVIVDAAKFFGHNKWIDKQFDKHDRKAGYHLEQSKMYAANR